MRGERGEDGERRGGEERGRGEGERRGRGNIARDHIEQHDIRTSQAF